MKIKIILSLLSLSLITTAPAVSAERKGPSAIAVVTEQVQVHQISQSLSLVGKLKADQSVTISPEVTGKVDKIAVKANQEVKKGQLLIQLNDDKAQASVSEAKAYLRDEQRKLKEFTRLAKRNAITQTEIDAQKASVEIAQARLDAANAELKDLHISAPFSATVGFIDFSLGKMVSAGSDLFTLDNLSVMRLDLRVPERYLSQVSTGMKVTATTSAWGDHVFEGEIVGIDSRINEETLNLRVRIHFHNEDHKLKPGMLVSANMEFPAIEAPIIPVQALEYSGTKRYVYVVGDNDKVTRSEVILGARVDNFVVIEKGVNIGEKIVVQGIVNMRDGASVKEVGKDGTAVDAKKEGGN